MKRVLSYVVLGMVLLFVSGGWAAAREIISFLSTEDKNGDRSIHFIDISGKFLQELMVGPGRINGPFSWSPGGRWITYGSDQDGGFDIYARDVRTNVEHRLTFRNNKADIWPAWSPDGKWIVFLSERGGERDIYRMDTDGKNIKRLTNQGPCYKPAWSPDSQQIAFVSKKPRSLFVMRADGRSVRHLADTSGLGCAWSPDGKEIAFVPRGENALFSIDVNGRNMRRFTQVHKGPVLISTVVWSPSGKWIAYTLWQFAGARGPIPPVSVIYVVNTAADGGGKPLEATRGLVVNVGLEWVPEGFLSVSPSSEKRTTLWGSLKQIENTSK